MRMAHIAEQAVRISMSKQLRYKQNAKRQHQHSPGAPHCFSFISAFCCISLKPETAFCLRPKENLSRPQEHFLRHCEKVRVIRSGSTSQVSTHPSLPTADSTSAECPGFGMHGAAPVLDRDVMGLVTLSHADRPVLRSAPL